MPEVLGIAPAVLVGQLLIGLINGSFYAMMSLGVAVIFGMLRIVNFVHGAQFMLGAFCGWALLNLPELFPALGLPAIGYWPALILVPLLVGAVGILIERIFIRRVYHLDHAYGLLLTVGLAMVIEGAFQMQFGSSGQAYNIPAEMRGGFNLGFTFLPYYRVWVVCASIAVCLAVWVAIERTKLGSYLRAATENPTLVEAFGINVPLMMTLTYGAGVALAALAGLMAAPIYQVSPQMGQNLNIIVFAVVVIGGMGSIIGAIISGIGLGVIEGLTKAFYPEASSTVIFIIMAIVLLMRPDGLFGKAAPAVHSSGQNGGTDVTFFRGMERHYLPLLACAGALAPFFVYPLFAMKVLILSLLAAAYNLLFGYVGLLAFGHAAFFGVAAYVAAETAKSLGLTPELSILAGIFCAGALGYVFALIAIRRQGLYFAMITLALAQLAYFYAVQAPWTGGDEGLHGIPRNKLFGLIDLSHPLAMYFLVLALFLGGFFVIQRTIRSPFGEILQAIRENEPRAISLGYNADQFKTVAFVISACLSGLAGALNALAFQYASLADMSFHFSGEILLMVLIGGVGTLLGPIAGAIVLAAMQHYLATSGALVIVLQGAIFVVCILAFPRGIAGTFGMWIEKWRVERRLSGTSETAEPGRGAVSVPPRPREVDAGEAMPALPDATN